MTFGFCAVENASRLWATNQKKTAAAMARLDELVRAVVMGQGADGERSDSARVDDRDRAGQHPVPAERNAFGGASADPFVPPDRWPLVLSTIVGCSTGVTTSITTCGDAHSSHLLLPFDHCQQASEIRAGVRSR
jgi:hypothetical protein